MKQKMDEFEESPDCINISNSITELKRKIWQLEYQYKYSLAHNELSSNGIINNGNEDSKEEQKMQYRSNSKVKSNIRSTQIKAINSNSYINVDNSIDWSDQNLWDELMVKDLVILEQFHSK